VHNNAPNHRSVWEVYATAYSGNAWTTPVPIPFSGARQDLRGGYAGDGRGNLYAAWSTDNRDFDEFLFQRTQVYAATRPSLGSAAPAQLVLKPRSTPKLVSFPVHQAEPEDLKRVRGYAIQSGGQTYRIYRGDTHRHTEFSMDGNNDGTLQQTYRYALDAAEMD